MNRIPSTIFFAPALILLAAIATPDLVSPNAKSAFAAIATACLVFGGVGATLSKIARN